ncbi:MAG: PLP-dependent aspartate aminotransferase family protein, partial [Bacteroidota bacterium]
IYQTSTYAQEEPGKHKGFEYARTQNPTRSALERNLARLENGTHAVAFSSGLAAMDAVIRLLEPGDEVIATNDLYGGSYRQMVRVHERYGVKTIFVDLSDLEATSKLITKKTRLIWIETPTNPMLKLIDIAAVTQLAKKKEVLTCVDNTFASPVLQNPIDMGVDLVLHSATKYLGGHSDVVMGAVITKQSKLAEKLYFLQNAVGAIPGPQDCFLMLRGIKTLQLRVERSCKNARKIAKYLSTHPKVDKVYYPGLKSHPQHQLAKRQMRDAGAMVSFDFANGTLEMASKVLSNTRFFTLAESLGGVESLIGHPATMTHASIPKAERLKVGLTDSLIRLSVGIEDVTDLIEDLEQALRNV